MRRYLSLGLLIATPEYGYIGLQNHRENDIVFFKEVAVRPVK
jgi:hypothetical protein